MLDKIKKLFCKHERTARLKEISMFQNLSGDRIYTICKDCNKVLYSVFAEHEGNGYK